MKTKEDKLFETTQYLITIAKRVMNPGPYGIDTELYFISEDVKEALENIGTKQARFFAKELKKSNLKDRKLPPELK